MLIILVIFFFHSLIGRTCNDIKLYAVLSAWVVTESDMMVVSEKKQKPCLCGVNHVFLCLNCESSPPF